jgi:hypothetical protein
LSAPSFSAELEAEYRSLRSSRVVPLERISAALAIVGFAGIAAWDAQIDSSGLPETLYIRLHGVRAGS